MHILLIIILFLSSNNVLPMKQKKYKLHRELTGEVSSRIVDAFFMPEEKNKIVLVYQTGILQLFDLEKDKSEKTLICFTDLGNIPGRTLQHAFYHNGIFNIITAPFVCESKNIYPQLNVEAKSYCQQQYCKLFLNKDNKPQCLDDTTLCFYDGTISYIDPEGNFIVETSTVKQEHTLFDITSTKNAQLVYPSLNTPGHIKKYAFNKKKKLCILAMQTNYHISVLSNSPITLENLLSLTKKETQLVLASTTDWKESWKRTIDTQSSDFDVQSLAFTKDGSQFACLTNKALSLHDTVRGEKLKEMTVPLKFIEPFFNTISYCKDELLLIDPIGKLCASCTFNSDTTGSIKTTIIPGKYLINSTARYNADKSMKAQVQNNIVKLYIKN